MLNKEKLKILATVLFPPLFFYLLYFGRIYPGVYLAGNSVGGTTPEEAISLVSKTIKPASELTLLSPKANNQEDYQTFKIPLESIEFSYDFKRSIQATYLLGRSGNWFYDLQKILKTLFKKSEYCLRINLNEEKLALHLSTIAGQVAEEPIFPTAEINNQQITIKKGKAGKDVDIEELRIRIGQNLAFAKTSPITIPTVSIDPSLNEEEIKLYKQKAEKFLAKTLEIEFESNTFVYPEKELISLLNPHYGYDEEGLDQLTENIAKKINREPRNPTFVFLSTEQQGQPGKVQEFTPAKEGIQLKRDELKVKIINALEELANKKVNKISLEAPVKRTPTEIQTGDINNLGIKELLGQGRSRFRGSSSSRVHNISLAASQLNGILIRPGEIFSFNNALGDVSKFTGYQEAYIIKEGKTVLGDGGGVCQVSTTFFRAALDAGLPIIERRAHAYRVSYYEQGSPVGFDATVYSPTADLKIKNNTPAHILIQAQSDRQNSKLIFEFYGTSDNRIATTSKPLVSNLTQPLEDLYIDDPSLPAGTIKQIDWKAWGAKVKFNYLVKCNSETIYSKTFYSNYQPWQAVFLRGTGL